MSKAKFVMFLYSLAALSSMIGIGFFTSFIFMTGTDKYDTMGILGVIACALLTVAIFGMGMVQKKKFREAGLL